MGKENVQSLQMFHEKSANLIRKMEHNNGHQGNNFILFNSIVKLLIKIIFLDVARVVIRKRKAATRTKVQGMMKNQKKINEDLENVKKNVVVQKIEKMLKKKEIAVIVVRDRVKK